jgi:aryl-alcohol dehydrogenase-like predicted oxidoreductase
MNFGTAWAPFMGDITKETSFKILDYYYEQGGNFIDTANGYQSEQSETWIGEWFEKTGRRDEFVVATKYSSAYKIGSKPGGNQVNFSGNSRKSMHMSVEASLQKLKTSYIDLLYVHWWDHLTPIEEVMQGLNSLVTSGKVLYIGISDAPAWVVTKANQYARDHGLAQFVVYQGRWSLGSRDLERDIIPMCKA